MGESIEKKLNWGILGCGRIAHFFCESVQLLSDARVYAVASTSEARAEAFKNEFSGAKAYTSYADLVDDDEVDVIYVATPHSFHFEHAMLCLKAQKPVLCEKPFTLDALQTKELLDAARANNTFIADAFWVGFHPAYLEAKRIVDSGEMGRLNLLRSDFGFNASFEPEGRLFNKRLGGGALMDVGVYPVFSALFYLGIPAEIQSFAQFAPTGVDQQMSIQFKYPNGQMADLYTSLVAQTPVDTDLYLEGGWMRIQRTKGYMRELLVCREEGVMERIDLDVSPFAFIYQIREVMRCVRQGLIESPLMPHGFTQNFIEVMDRIKAQVGIDYSK